MKIQYVHFLFNKYKTDRSETGFTLIELMVVVILIGLISAIALPNFIGQVGKARETEAKNNLGAIGRAQQVYHFEHQVFASSLDSLSGGDFFNAEYYDYLNPDLASRFLLKQRAVSLDSDYNRTRNYAVGVYFNAGAYQIALCEGKAIGEIVQVPDASTGLCTNDGTRIK